MSNRENFTSTFGIIAAAAGSAVGLGNIWRFPYIAGQNGGGAFLIIYILIVLILGVPLLMSEMMIGRRAQANVIGSFKKLGPKSSIIIGIIGLLAAFLILAFYSTVGGWTIHYIYASINGEVFHTDYQNYFFNFKDNSFLPLLWQIVFLALTAVIILGGVKKGIEKCSKIMIPTLVLMLIILVIRAVTLPGAGSGVNFFMKPDFSKVTGTTFLAAMGQAFFSLSIGMGAMLTYGSYIQKNENLNLISTSTAITDIMVAILGGLVIFPTLFSFNAAPDQGPGLIFVTLPAIFEQMPWGAGFSTIFFVLLLIASISSSISLLEVIVAVLKEELHWSRTLSTILTTISVTILGFFATLSWNTFQNIFLTTASGNKMYIFDIFDYLSSNILLPLGGLLIMIYVGWYLKKDIFYEELLSGVHKKFTLALRPIIFFIVKYISPIVILLIFLNGIGVF